MSQALVFSVFALLQLTQLVLAVPSAPLPVDALNTAVRSTCRSGDCPSGYSLGSYYRSSTYLCSRSSDSYTALSKAANCPSGYTNMGLTCYRGPHSYTKCCTTIWSKCRCKSGYTNMGCHCQRWAKTLTSSHMICDSGYFLNKELGRCYKVCKSGYKNKGEYCHRPSSTIDYTCKSGEKKESYGKCCSSTS